MSVAFLCCICISKEVFALLIQALSVITDVFVVTPNDFFLRISLGVMLMK